MAEYIKREVALDAITNLAGKAPTRSAYEAVWKSARVLKKIPAADVAPVVRCKDCVHCGFCGDATNLQVMGFYGFCSRGERKDGGDNDAKSM